MNKSKMRTIKLTKDQIIYLYRRYNSLLCIEEEKDIHESVRTKIYNAMIDKYYKKGGK